MVQVEEVRARRWVGKGRTKKLEYRVKWKDHDDLTWVRIVTVGERDKGDGRDSGSETQ